MATAALPVPREAEPRAMPRYSRPRRRDLPDSDELREARSIARRRQQALARAESLYAELLRAVAEMRRAGYSHTEVAEAIGVTKARAQQLCNEAADAGHDITPPQG